MQEAAAEGTAIQNLLVWFRAIRPWSLTASIVPVMVGTSLAVKEGYLLPLLFVLTLSGSLLVQIGSNLTDEYFDHKRNPGAPKYPAPYKVIELGLLSPRAVLLGAYASFAMATAIGIYIVAEVGWPILAVALASLLVAYFYSGGPKPLGNLALGEPLVFLFMGSVMVMATYYVQTRVLTWEAFWVSLPIAFLVTAILVANDIRDRDEDLQASKVTPVTLLGTGIGRGIYVNLLLGSSLVIPMAVILGMSPWVLLIVLVSLPRAFWLMRALFTERERSQLNALMRGTARLHMEYGLLLTLGLVSARFIS